MKSFTAFISVCMLAVLSMGAVGFAQPTTAPSNIPSVMIFPFHQLGDTSEHSWVAEAMNHDLVAKLSLDGGARLVEPDHSLGAAGADAAIAAGRTARADYVIFGSYIVVGDQLRVDGQIVNCPEGKQVAALSNTGAMRDFFKIEDAISAQARQVISPAIASSTGVEVVPGNSPPPQVELPATTYIYQQPAETYAYPDTGYYYPPADYGYPYYGGFYGGITIFRNRGFDHDRDHHRDFDRGHDLGHRGTFNAPHIYRPGFTPRGIGPTFHGSIGGGAHVGGGRR